MQLVVDGHNELVGAYNKNWQGFGASIQHLDSRIGALALVLDDLVRGGVENITKLSAVDLGLHEAAEHPTIGGVHWAGYIKMYLNQVEAELAELKARQDLATAQAEPFSPLITPEAVEETTEDGDVMFGGKDSNDGEASTGLESRATG